MIDTSIAQQVHCTGAFDLPCGVDEAFPLFSPEGERAWAPGWNPKAVFPETIAFAPNTIFRQGEGVDEAVWTILQVDSGEHKAEYFRVAPASHTARISVNVEAIGPDRSHVEVSYDVTGFGPDGEHALEGFSERAYGERMRDWQRRISACIAACK